MTFWKDRPPDWKNSVQKHGYVKESKSEPYLRTGQVLPGVLDSTAHERLLHSGSEAGKVLT